MRGPRGSGRRGVALAGIGGAAALLAAACGVVFPPFPDYWPLLRAGEGLKEAKFRIVAKDYACDPSVIAIDREGRAMKVALTVATVGKQHIFLAPDLLIRRTIPPDQEITIEFVADRSGVFEFGCSRLPAFWMTPFEKRGRLAIK